MCVCVDMYLDGWVLGQHRKFEKDKQRKYEQRIREVAIEMASFTPLVFSTSSGMSGACN